MLNTVTFLSSLIWEKVRNKSLTFAGKIKKEKLGKKMRISNCFGDPTGNGTL